MNYILLMSLFILTVFGCSYMAARLLTDHVGHFIERINVELDENSLETMDAVIDKGDLQGIEKRIRKLIRDTQEYCARLDQYEAEKNRMELELLQMRFNPHFLYNTLASIRYQLKDSSIRKMIDSLIHYYRIVLSKGELFISIFSEMEMIKEYLELEIFSYCLENIAYELNVDEEVKDCNIIKHLLQPIVENALEHGVRASEKKGIIRIQAKPDGEDIVFVIEDNGIGMTGQQIENVMSGVGRENMDGGYGIYNVKQRIETYYGKEYGIDFYSVLNEGTRVTLRIPKQHAAHNTDID